jgi:DHA2 family multidrug resistance protein
VAVPPTLLPRSEAETNATCALAWARARTAAAAVDWTRWSGDAVHGHVAALKQLWALTWREAQTQTYADAFLAMAACFVVATAMVPLMRKVVPPKGPTADAH